MKDRKCLVIGAGISGKAASALLLREGARVTLFDGNEKTDLDGLRAFFGKEDRISLYKGSLPEEVKNETELLVLSPGVPPENDMVTFFREKGTEIIGEVELAWRCGKGQVLAITGTNGKTTTTTLLGEIMKAWTATDGKGRDVHVVGNIGDPYTGCADSLTEDSIVVAEISSFQLETVKSFKPRVSAILNVTPDHLNRHHTMENYTAMKRRITEYQDEKDTVVLNYDDPLTREMAEDMKPKVIFFTSEHAGELKGSGRDHLSLRGKDIFINEEKLISIDEIRLLGTHNYENVMAAAGMAASFGVPYEVIRDTIREFRAVEHRIEFVETVNGVDYYNDSKGTNPDASIKAVQAMVKPCILIAGGYDKDSSYDEFIEAFDGKVKHMILMGATAGKIEDCALRHGFKNCLRAESLKEAVGLCAKTALPGDAVLLSPACASWDMFTNYEERGRLFKEYVRSL